MLSTPCDRNIKGNPSANLTCEPGAGIIDGVISGSNEADLHSYTLLFQVLKK